MAKLVAPAPKPSNPGPKPAAPAPSPNVPVAKPVAPVPSPSVPAIKPVRKASLLIHTLFKSQHNAYTTLITELGTKTLESTTTIENKK